MKKVENGLFNYIVTGNNETDETAAAEALANELDRIDRLCASSRGFFEGEAVREAIADARAKVQSEFNVTVTTD